MSVVRTNVLSYFGGSPLIVENSVHFAGDLLRMIQEGMDKLLMLRPIIHQQHIEPRQLAADPFDGRIDSEKQRDLCPDQRPELPCGHSDFLDFSSYRPLITQLEARAI